MMLIAQTHNTIAYHRRENVLATLIDSPSRVKEILKNQSKELNEASNKFLFGEEFESRLLKDSKAIKKSEKLFTGIKKPSTSNSKRFYSTDSKRPFQGGPLL